MQNDGNCRIAGSIPGQTGAGVQGILPQNGNALWLATRKPRREVDASAAADFITVEKSEASAEPPLTVLTLTCKVHKEGPLVAEWQTLGGGTETREVAIRLEGDGQATMAIPDVRCLKGQKVVIKPKG